MDIARKLCLPGSNLFSSQSFLKCIDKQNFNKSLLAYIEGRYVLSLSDLEKLLKENGYVFSRSKINHVFGHESLCELCNNIDIQGYFNKFTGNFVCLNCIDKHNLDIELNNSINEFHQEKEYDFV